MMKTLEVNENQFKVKKASNSEKNITRKSQPINYCYIDLNKQKKSQNKISDEEYLRALKLHTDPRKADPNSSFEIQQSVDRQVFHKLRSLSVEPNQRNSFENWCKYKTTQAKLKRFYLCKEKQQILSSASKKCSEGEPNSFEGNFKAWVKRKIREKRQEKEERFREKSKEVEKRQKMLQDGVSYKEWVLASLAKERKEKVKEIKQIEQKLITQKEQEEQKYYEKKARRYLEKIRRAERLAKLSVKRGSLERKRSKSPLLLAYSPNKYNAFHEQALYKQAEFLSNSTLTPA